MPDDEKDQDGEVAIPEVEDTEESDGLGGDTPDFMDDGEDAEDLELYGGADEEV
jgi:hypothetical protein